MIILREYQIDLIEKARERMKAGVKSLIITAPTGSGKTCLTAYMLAEAERRRLRSLFLVHRRELIKQSVDTMLEFGITPGVIAAEEPEHPERLVQVASVQTLVRRLIKYPKPKLIVTDEAHHSAASTWRKIIRTYNDAYHIGLTATPARHDGRPLGEFYDEIISGPSVTDLIAQNYLCPFKVYIPPQIDLTGVHTRMGDYDRHELELVSNKAVITGSAINEYKKHADGQRAVIFCVTIKHSQDVCAQFNSVGIVTEHVDGETPKNKRDAAVERFRNGETKVLTNVDLFGEGFDLPAMQAVFLLRPTKSLVLHRQQLGRVLRPYPGKTNAIILDHAGNIQRLGLPDEEIEWTLLGRVKRDTKREKPIRMCPECFAANSINALQCSECGYKFPAKERKIAQAPGELIEIKSRIIARKEVGRARDLQSLIALGKARGYRYPTQWAHFVFNARVKKYENKNR